MGQPPTVTVAVCTRNRPQLLRELVASLYASGGRSPSWVQTVVVDQSTNDASYEVLRNCPLWRDEGRLYIRMNAKGLSRARNEAVKSALGEVVVFVDDDVRVPPRFAEEIAAHFDAHPELAAMFAPVEVDLEVWQAHQDGTIPSFTPAQECVVDRPDPSAPTGIGANFAMRRSIAEAFPFDEFLGAGSTFHSWEEIDVTQRLSAAGHAYGVFLYPAVIHTGIRTGRNVRRWVAATECGRGAAVAKQARLGLRSYSDVWLRHPVRVLSRSLVNMAHTGRPRGLGRIAHYYGGALRSLRYAVDRERGTFSRRRRLGMPRPLRALRRER